MRDFLSLPRYPFKRAVIEHAPDDHGVYGLFDGEEVIYIGAAYGAATIREVLLRHQDGALGACTMKATAYTWQITRMARARAAAILDGIRGSSSREPRCQKAA